MSVCKPQSNFKSNVLDMKQYILLYLFMRFSSCENKCSFETELKKLIDHFKLELQILRIVET